jgi:hypothetical protein
MAVATAAAAAAAATQDVWKAYVRDTRVEVTLQEELGAIMREPVLPANPYPRLAQRARREAARHALSTRAQDLQEQLARAAVQPASPGRPDASDPSVALFSGCEMETEAWGLSGLLSIADLRGLRGLRALVNDLCAGHEQDVPLFPDVRGTLMLSVGGPALFRRLLPHAASAVLRFDYLIAGPSLDYAVDLFAHYVVRQAQDVARRHASFLTKLLVVSSDKRTTEWRAHALRATDLALVTAIAQVHTRTKRGGGEQ